MSGPSSATTPAMFANKSMRPNSLSADWTVRVQSSAFVVSITTALAVPPSAAILSTVVWTLL